MIIEKDNKLWTTSLDIAEKFGKRHKNVIRAIENLDVPKDFYRLNFQPISREVQGGESKYFIISRDGEILGHEKLSTTDIYIQSLKPSTKEALEGFEKELFEKNENEDIYKKQGE